MAAALPSVRIILLYMAIPRVKATYSLDPETVKVIERLARRWDTSKSDVLRRAVRIAAASAPEAGDSSALAALDRLHDSLGLTERVAAAWARRARAERRASAKHRGR